MSSQPINFEVTIETIPLLQFSVFVAEHPEIIDVKFWHGQTALHKVCLRQDANVAMLRTLLQAGADVNGVNSFGETPLMFAAKRGSAALCQFLLDNKADHTFRDKAGRQVIHHAVMGGSTHLTHFLHTVYDYDLDAEDGRRQTPLHISSSQGNLPMVNYLLRSRRCSCKKADIFGNTALHHAAIYGHQQVAYSILYHGGLAILDLVNEKAETPMDICSSKGSKQLATIQIFEAALQQKSKGNQTFQPPRLLWYWYMLMPVTFFLGGQLIAELLQTVLGWYSGSVVMSVVLIYIIYLFQIHGHRIKHFSGLPNPMHAGAFGAGLIGTPTAWLVVILPRLRMDDGTNVILCVLVMMFIPLTFYLYWLLIVSDPGYIALPNKDVPMSSAMKLAIKSDGSVDRFCAYCDTLSSGNVKHCKLCERCVVSMDHHCLFLLKCVAKNNHRLFTVFVIIANIDIMLFLATTCRYFYHMYGRLNATNFLSHMATEHNFILFVIILNFFSIMWGTMLVQWQLRLISQGFTFYESISHKSEVAKEYSKLTLRERGLNIIRFFKGQTSAHGMTLDVV